MLYRVTIFEMSLDRIYSLIVIFLTFVLLEFHQRVTQTIFVHKSSLFYMNKTKSWTLSIKIICFISYLPNPLAYYVDTIAHMICSPIDRSIYEVRYVLRARILCAS